MKERPYMLANVYLPNGMSLCLPFEQGDDIGEAVNYFMRRWKKAMAKDPEGNNIKVLEEKCPICGEPLYQGGESIWCASCDYERHQEN